MLETLSFNFDGTPVRTAGTPDHPLFCLPDVCAVLGIDNSRNVASRLDPNGVHSVDTVDSLGKRQAITFVDEPNLYRAIFQSRKPDAQRFQTWVFSEVLPQIRKTGAYQPTAPAPGLPSAPTPALALAPAEQVTQTGLMLMMAQHLHSQQQQIDDLQDFANQQKQIQIEARAALAELPPAQVPTPILVSRRAILKVVNAYCIAKNIEYQTAWNALYEELRLRCGVAVKLRAKVSPHESYLDVVVRLGYADQLYAIALDLFGINPEANHA
jgi:prophage antirepressor-like protein